MDEVSIIWMMIFFLEENKSEAITAIILQPIIMCPCMDEILITWMKFILIS